MDFNQKIFPRAIHNGLIVDYQTELMIQANLFKSRTIENQHEVEEQSMLLVLESGLLRPSSEHEEMEVQYYIDSYRYLKKVYEWDLSHQHAEFSVDSWLFSDDLSDHISLMKIRCSTVQDQYPVSAHFVFKFLNQMKMLMKISQQPISWIDDFERREQDMINLYSEGSDLFFEEFFELYHRWHSVFTLDHRQKYQKKYTEIFECTQEIIEKDFVDALQDIDLIENVFFKEQWLLRVPLRPIVQWFCDLMIPELIECDGSLQHVTREHLAQYRDLRDIFIKAYAIVDSVRMDEEIALWKRYSTQQKENENDAELSRLLSQRLIEKYQKNFDIDAKQWMRDLQEQYCQLRQYEITYRLYTDWISYVLENFRCGLSQKLGKHVLRQIDWKALNQIYLSQEYYHPVNVSEYCFQIVQELKKKYLQSVLKNEEVQKLFQGLSLKETWVVIDRYQKQSAILGASQKCSLREMIDQRGEMTPKEWGHAILWLNHPLELVPKNFFIPKDFQKSRENTESLFQKYLETLSESKEELYSQKLCVFSDKKHEEIKQASTPKNQR